MNTTYQEVARFHGHECPGMTVGIRIAELVVDRLGRNSIDNELVATAETDSCAVDAIQVLTGCTFGRRNLRHVDNGKNTFTFWRRSDGAGLKVSCRPDSIAYRDSTTWELAKLIENGTASEADRTQFAERQAARIKRILAVPSEEILIVQDVDGEIPEQRPLQPSAPCDGCGDPTSTEILHNHRGRMLCPPCHLEAHGGVLPPDHGHGHGHGHGEQAHSHGEHAHQH